MTTCFPAAAQRLTLFVAALLCVLPGLGQVAQANRVADGPDLQQRVTLSRHVAPWAVRTNEAGAAEGTAALRLTVVLARSPEREAAFQSLLAAQQEPRSASYHHWLTPQQIGEQFGPTDHDVLALTQWLNAQGLPVVEVAPSRMFVTVKGTVAAASAAFRTSFGTYSVRGGTHVAAQSEPSVPSAFAALVSSIDGLNDLQPEPMHSMVTPAFNSNNGTHFVMPADFGIVYDVNAAYSAGVTGTGQKVAIVGRSRVSTADVTNYELRAGLSPKLQNEIVPPAGVDPGQTATGDQGEATLDVQRVLGTAPGAQADLVIASTASGGINTAMQYEVQTLLDPILTISFGTCEALSSGASATTYNTLFSQAAAEGISVFVSSGDSGAAGCDAHGTTPPATAQFASMNVICSSPYVTCVGGTEFADAANPSQYWNATNGTNNASALSYIPEGAWNDPTSTDANGNVTYRIGSTGGGASMYLPKPAYQTGVGVPTDGARDTPDVSFSAAGHDAYFGCYTPGGGTCVSGTNGSYSFVGFSGTSAAAPSMAAVTALLNQKLGGAQGALNPLLYGLAANTANGAFHDTTVASSGVANCTTTTASMCNNSTPSVSSTAGGFAGFQLTTGYDQATGWGSLDVNKFLTAAAGYTKSSLTATTLGVAANTSAVALGQNVTFTLTANASSGTTSGTVQLYADTKPIGSPVAVTAGTPTTATVAMTVAGSLIVTGVFTPGSGYAGSSSNGIAISVTGNPSVTTIAAAANTVVVNGTVAFTATVVGPSVNGTPAGTPTGVVEFAQSGLLVATVQLVNGTATSGPITFSTVGNIPVYAYYRGDATYALSSSATTTVTVTAAPPSYAVSASPTSLSLAAGATSGNVSTLTVTPSGGFTGAVNLTCGVAYTGTGTSMALPACSLGSQSVTVSGTAAVTTTVTLTTTARSNVVTRPLALAGIALLQLMALRRRRGVGVLMAVVVGVMLVGLGGCGGSSAPAAPTGTTAGVYTVTVSSTTTASGVAAASPVTIALTVN